MDALYQRSLRLNPAENSRESFYTIFHITYFTTDLLVLVADFADGYFCVL
jgi:hypothetical protein